jgi:hypothetical protein
MERVRYHVVSLVRPQTQDSDHPALISSLQSRKLDRRLDAKPGVGSWPAVTNALIDRLTKQLESVIINKVNY